MKPLATFDRVSEFLAYDANTGNLYWKVRRGKAVAGAVAGVEWHTQGKRYRVVTLDNRQYFAHRIAWLLHFGKWPAYNIDHIDGDGTNNRILNLRDVPQSENCKNKRPLKSAGRQWGVRFQLTRWHAQIKVGGNVIYLGSFATEQEAVCRRKQAEIEYGFSGLHGTKVLQ